MTDHTKGEPPNERSAVFVGRDREIQQVLDALDSRAWIVSIVGSGGIGKTRLLREVSSWVDREQNFDRILNLHGKEFSSYQDLLNEIAQKLGLSEPVPEDMPDLEQQIHAKLGDQRVLLVLDAFERISDDPQVKDFLRMLPAPSKALMTTRHRLGIAEREIALSELTFSDARLLIQAEAERLGSFHLGLLDHSNQRRLWEVSGGSPLAIKWLVEQIAQSGVQVDRFLETYSKKLSDGDADLLAYLFSDSWRRLDSRSQRLLISLALSEKPLSRSNVKSVTELSNVETEEALRKLIDLSLVHAAGDLGDPIISVLPLTKRYVEILLTKEVSHDQATDLVLSLERKQVLRSLILLAEAIDLEKDEFTRRSRHLLDGLVHLLDATQQDTEVVYRRLHGFIVDVGSIFSHVNALKQLPIVVVRRSELRRIDLESAKHLIGTKLGSPKRICLLVLLTRGENLDKARRRIERERRSLYGFDFILLTEEEIRRIALASNSIELLRTLILSQVDLAAISPFVTTGRTPDSIFFGREEVFRQIVEHVDSTSYAVIGGRRIGKTSTLGRLHNLHLPAVGFLTLYHDCSIMHTYNNFLAADVRDWRPEAPLNPPVKFADLLKFPPKDKPLVLLLDEADKFVPTDRASNWQLFNALRALANSGHAQVILSGERSLRDALRDPQSPLFNFANEILLGPLEFRAAEELVTRPMKQLEIELVDEKALVDRIWAFTSGHPNIMQRLCRRLIERLNEQSTRRITLDDVDAVIEAPGFQREDFLSTYWEAATALEKVISLLMCDDENVRTLREVRHTLTERCGLSPSAREVDDALQRLVDLRSILKRTPSGYEFAVEAFPRVVAGTMTLADMLMILTEEYEESGE